jgi:splicing factor 3A subunit 1
VEKSNIASSTQITTSTSMSVSVSAVLPNPLARALKSFDELSLSATSAPKPFYSVLTPIGITAAAADRIKLTAEFTATSGRRFLASLTSREFNNPEFDFLRPSHAHFSYYTALVDAFAKVLTPPTSVVSKIEALSDDTRSSYSFLEAVVHEAEWMRLEEEKKRKDEDANASSAVHIDWHSFVVVETVELKDFVFEKDGWDGKGSSLEAMPLGGEEDGSGDGDMDVEEEEEEEEMDVDNTGGGNEEFLNIRMDYIPSDQSTSTTTGLRESPSRSIHHASSSSGGGGGEVFLDPISGLSIPIDRANEHIKAQMLDPQAKQNRLRFEAKQSKTLFTTGEDVASNLKNLIGKKSADDGKTVSSLSNTKSTPIVEIGVEMPPTAKNGPAQKRPRTSDN